MTNGNILDVVIAGFLSKVELERQLPSEVEEELKRLAEERALSQQERVEAALKSGPLADGEAKES